MATSREGEAIALNIFDLTLINENAPREGEAPAELFPAATHCRQANDARTIACERYAAAEYGSAGASPSRFSRPTSSKDV